MSKNKLGCVYKHHYLFFPPQVASPSLHYIMAVQNHLLSNTLLIHPDDSDDSDNSLQGETMKVQVNISFKCPLLFNICAYLWNCM